MPVNMVDANGVVRAVPDDEVAAAMAQGFRPESIDESATRVGREVKEEQFGGIGGKAKALAAGVARGVTLGGSDVLGDALGFGGELQALKEVNPITSTIGEVGGGVAAAFASPSSMLGKMPAGYLARVSNEANALARGVGGVKGAAGALAATGTEAAAQNAGMYLSDVALGNRQLTAEGLAGALGTGFAFGTAAGGAMLGIEKGSISARRMFAHTMDGGPDAVRSAAGEWERRSAEVFDGNRQTLDAAKERLEQARLAAQEAQLAQQRSAQMLAQERALAARAVPEDPFVPTPPEPLAVPDSHESPFTLSARAGQAVDEVAESPMLARKPWGPPPPATGGDVVSTDATAPIAKSSDIPEYDDINKQLEPDGEVAMAPAPDVATRASSVTQADPPRPMSDDDLEVARQNFQASATPHEFMSVADYQGGFFGKVNRTLRGHPEADDLQHAEHVAEITRNLDSVLDKNRLEEPAVLYRGVRPFAELDNLRPGDVFVDRAFQSTSTDPKRIMDADVVFHISAPAGTRAGALIRDTSNHRGGYLLEKEVLLDRNTALRLDRVEKQKHYKFGDDITVMHFTVVGQRGEDITQAGARSASAETVPDFATLQRKIAESGEDAFEQTIPAAEIAARGFYEEPGAHVSAYWNDVAARAIREGQTDPIELMLDADGRIMVEDGRRRLAAAIDQGADIKVKWSLGDGPLESDVFRQVPIAKAPSPSRPSFADDVFSAAAKAEKFGGVGSGGLGSTSAALPVPAESQRLAAAVAEAEDAESVLMQRLAGTKARVDAGESISQISASARAHPTSKKQLEDAYEEIAEQAAEATDIETKQALLRQASQLEEQLAATSPKALDDVDAVVQAMARYEKAMADVADELQEATHPATREMVDAVRNAETEVERKMLDRAAHAIDDNAEQYGPWEQVGPKKMSPKERVAYARERKLEADATLAGRRADMTQARQAYGSARAATAATKQAAGTISLQPPVGLPQAGQFGLSNIGTGLELAGLAGVPGLPQPSDLPIIGPLLGMWLKLRAIKGGADRLMGRVPATGNARAAALASQTRDKAARVVDKMLGLVERKSPAIRAATVAAGVRAIDAVRDRVHDDGNPAPEKSAGLTDHVAARIREIDTLVTNPALITAQVRRELRDVADPDTVAAAIQFRTSQLKYLHDNAPKEPPPSPFRKGPWKPNKAECTDFARRFAVAMDPLVALEQVEQRTLTPESAEAFRAVYPLIYAQTQQRLLSRAVELKQSLPRQQLIRMSILFDIPLDSALEPTSLASFQAALAPSSPAATAQQSAPAPSPSIAGAVGLTSVFQTPADRRAAM